MLEVAEADPRARLCPSPGVPQIARRARRRERSGVPSFTMAAWVASHAPECTELTVEGDRGFESGSLQRRVGNEPGRRLRPIVRIAETLGYESQNAFARTLGGNISRNSCRKKAPARCKNPDDPPADAAATSSAALSCPFRTGILLMRSLPVRSSPFLAQCSSCTSTMPARTAVRNTTWSRSVPFRGSSGLAVVNAGA